MQQVKCQNNYVRKIITTIENLSRRGKQEWTIQRHYQHWANKTHNEEDKKMSNI